MGQHTIVCWRLCHVVNNALNAVDKISVAKCERETRKAWCTECFTRHDCHIDISENHVGQFHGEAGLAGPDQQQRCLAVFQREILLPAVAPLAPGLLSGLRAQGLATVVVSATRASLVEPVARHLAVDHLLTSCFGPQKVHRVEAWLKAQGCSIAGLEESWFYSDSHNDLPLLEAVSHPVAVDPDLRLARLAAQRQWPVLSLRRDIDQPLAA